MQFLSLFATISTAYAGGEGGTCPAGGCKARYDGAIYEFADYNLVGYKTDSVDYDTDMSMFALKHSYAAYAPKENLENWNCGCCEQSEISPFTTKLVYDEGHNLAYIGVRNDKPWIVLTFRGTANTCGWVCNDFHFNEVKYPGVEGATIHEGFYKVWNDGGRLGKPSYLGYENQFMPVLEQLGAEYTAAGQECKIIVTGHSLGAALAHVAAVSVADMLAEKESEINCELSVFTYGSPRWANPVLSDYFNNHPKIYQAWRVVNGYDVVPQLPPKYYFNFYHPSTHVWYEQSTPNAPFVGNPIDGEENDHGYKLKDCIFHSEACLQDHVKYLGYTADDGKCTEVSLSVMSRIYNNTMALAGGPSSRASVPGHINLIWNMVCQEMCVDENQ